MTTTQLTKALALLCALALFTVACGSGGPTLETADPAPLPTPTAPVEDDDNDDDPVETEDTPTDTDPEPTPVVEDDTPPPGPPTVLFSTFTSGGFVPVDIALSAYPDLVVMSDGVVYRPGAQAAIFPPPLTPAIERLQLGDATLDEIEDLIAASTVLVNDLDVGHPNITDVATTSITSSHDGTEVNVSVYGLEFDNGVTPAQAESRAALSSLISAVTAVVDGASSTGELTEPPALGLLTFPGLTFQEDAVVLDWPIESVPVPQDGGADCVVIGGAELSTVWAAATGATTQTPWNIDGEAKVVVFRPVFPHEDFC